MPKKIMTSEETLEHIKQTLLIKPIGVDLKLKEVQGAIKKSMDQGENRFVILKEALDKEFPIGTNMRGAADGLVYYLFDSALELYFIGNYSGLFIELQGLLERFCVDKVSDFIAVNHEAKILLQDAFAKKTLNDVAEYFQIIDCWSEEEVKFAKKLTQIRNGIAHKNTKLISKLLGNGEVIATVDIDKLVKKTDIISYIVKVIELLVRITEVAKPGFIKNPRFMARLEAYSGIVGFIFNFFLEDGFSKLPSTIKFTTLGRLFASSILLGSAELGDLLGEYKVTVLKFHESLLLGSNEAEDERQKLILLSDKIFDEMRVNLNIDGDASSFKKPPFNS